MIKDSTVAASQSHGSSQHPYYTTTKISQLGDFLYRVRYFLYGLGACLLVGGAYYIVTEKRRARREQDAQHEAYPAYYNCMNSQLPLEEREELALHGDYTAMGFLEVIEKYPDTRVAQDCRMRVAQIYRRQGKAAEAIALLKEVRFADYFWQQFAWTMLGDIYHDQGETELAVASYKKAIDSCANLFTARILCKLALLLENRGELAAALECYEKAYKYVRPDHKLHTEVQKLEQMLKTRMKFSSSPALAPVSVAAPE